MVKVLDETFERLEVAFAHQSRFTSAAAHELRTPIAVILSETQATLARDRDPAEYREALLACGKAAQRMRALTESLLDLARLDAGAGSGSVRRVDLATVAAACLERLAPEAARRGIQLERALGPAAFVGAPELLDRVVANLVRNAVEYTAEGGRVTVTTRGKGTKASLVVADTGKGIDVADLPYVFDRFFRGDASHSGSSGHHGLGLAICKAIVDAQGGTIDVTSRLGEGSTFTVTWA